MGLVAARNHKRRLGARGTQLPERVQADRSRETEAGVPRIRADRLELTARFASSSQACA